MRLTQLWKDVKFCSEPFILWGYMLPERRRNLIVKEIETQGFGTINDLSEKFSVSDMTIRRDLSMLQEDGRIRRTRGGAIPTQTVNVELQYASKQLINRTSKELIARYAAENFVRDGDIIILEGGTTATMMVPYLQGIRNLTVITNGLYTTLSLQKMLPDLTLICTGGILREPSSTFVGPIVKSLFNDFHANKAFLSTTGLLLNFGFTDPSLLETEVKKAMIAASDQVIMLLDSGKVGVKSLVKVMNTSEPDILITDEDIPEDVILALQSNLQIEIVRRS